MRIEGVVIQWTAVIMSGIHVDPLAIVSKAVVDATGHYAKVLTIAARKILELQIDIVGEKSMNVPNGEKFVVEKQVASFQVYTSRAWLLLPSMVDLEWAQYLVPCCYLVKKSELIAQEVK